MDGEQRKFDWQSEEFGKGGEQMEEDGDGDGDGIATVDGPGPAQWESIMQPAL